MNEQNNCGGSKKREKIDNAQGILQQQTMGWIFESAYGSNMMMMETFVKVGTKELN